MELEHSLPWRQMPAEPQEMILMQRAMGTKGYKVNSGDRLLPRGFPRPRTTSGTSEDGCCADTLEVTTTTLSSRTTDTILP